jgi:hypothetical protein
MVKIGLAGKFRPTRKARLPFLLLLPRVAVTVAVARDNNPGMSEAPYDATIPPRCTPNNYEIGHQAPLNKRALRIPE